MKGIMEALRSARRLEWFILLAAAAVLLVLCMGDGGSEAVSPGEARLKAVLESIDGAGRVSVMLSGEEGAYTGAVVTATGADEIAVLLRLQRAVHALTGLETQDIEIMRAG